MFNISDVLGYKIYLIKDISKVRFTIQYKKMPNNTLGYC